MRTPVMTHLRMKRFNMLFYCSRSCSIKFIFGGMTAALVRSWKYRIRFSRFHHICYCCVRIIWLLYDSIASSCRPSTFIRAWDQFQNLLACRPQKKSFRTPTTENKIDVIGVAESWLSDNVIDAELCIDGYKLYQKDRLQVKPGREGGILLYVKNKIVFWECAVTVAKLMHW